jgi:hypothetical protein
MAIHTENEEHSTGTTHVKEDNGNWHVEGSATGTVGGCIICPGSASATVGGGHGEGWSSSNGGNTNDSKGSSDTLQIGINVEDNYSKQTTDLTTETQG